MEPRAILPLDIFLYIIDLLADGDDEDIKSLQTLSQACKSMVPLCRKHLFSSLHLRRWNSKCFSDLLSKNPDIACYVRSLEYIIYNSEHELNILDMLKKHSSLQSIELTASGLDWNDFPASMRSSLVTLIQLPTVTKLSIQYFQRFPAMALSSCSNLIDLRLIELELELAPREVNQVISRSKIPTPVSLYVDERTYGITTLLNSASLHAHDPIVDFSRLQKAEFDLDCGSDIGQVNELIEVTTRLESLSIYTTLDEDPDRPVWLTGLGASLAINAYWTLKLLAPCFTFRVNREHLCGLSRELTFIAGNNILERLQVELDMFFEDTEDSFLLPDSEDWSAFDSVLTESGAFPMLHRVSVVVWGYEAYRGLSEGEAFSESINEDNFPRLVESKAVEFNFSVKFH